jgi:hypothetical protein
MKLMCVAKDKDDSVHVHAVKKKKHIFLSIVLAGRNQSYMFQNGWPLSFVCGMVN